MTKRTWLILAVVGGVLSLCCLGSGVLMVVGAASGDSSASASATGGTAAGGGGLEGTWMAGSVSLTTYRSVATGEEAPPSGTGELLELKAGGDCARALVLQSTVYSCTSYIFVHTDDCAWRFDGTTLSLELGPGTTRSRMCGGEVKEGESKAQSLQYRARVAREGDFEWLTLTDAADGAQLRLRRAQ